MIRFSIATVCYNAADDLHRTIASVEAQTHPAIEHLIIDGNSQDETMAVIHHYQERNSRAAVPHDIVCRSEPDEGIYDAMNKARQLATGDYILYLNAGDTLHDDGLLARLSDEIDAFMDAEQLERHRRPAVLYGDTDLVDREGRFMRHRRLAPPEQLKLEDFKHGMLVCHQAFFVRMDLAKKCAYHDDKYRFSADYDWCIRVMREAKRLRLRLYNCHCVVADYLNEGVTTQNHSASLKERFHIMAHHYGMATAVTQHLWFVIRAFLKK